MPSINGISHLDLTVTDLEASLDWYRELLGTVPLFGAREDDLHLDVRYVMEPNSGVILGLRQHDANDGSPFDERRVGLDHVAFNVESSEEMDAWLSRLDELKIDHSGITVEEPWDVLVFRDPDNIQLELFYLKFVPPTESD